MSKKIGDCSRKSNFPVKTGSGRRFGARGPKGFALFVEFRTQNISSKVGYISTMTMRALAQEKKREGAWITIF